MSGRHWSDEELGRLLSATRAEASRAPLEHALARLEAERLPAWLAWTARPWALAAACGLLAVSLASGALMVRSGVLGEPSASVTGTTTAALTDTDPVAQLLGEDSSSLLSERDASATPDDSGSFLR